MFSNASSNSISFAIVTPSFVISGAPKDLSKTTFLPFGPNVTLTVFANWLTPASKAARASAPCLISFAMFITSYYFLLSKHNVIFANSLFFIFLYSF